MCDTGRVAKPIDWHRLLIDGYEPLKKGQRVFRRLPGDPRCKLCQNPFGGIGGKLFGVIGRKPSRKNPNLCQYCFDHLPPGGDRNRRRCAVRRYPQLYGYGRDIHCFGLCQTTQSVLRRSRRGPYPA
jgi:hypothetical protein